MPWLIGIDEAGYGPNLGPLVMTAVACRVPLKQNGNLWRPLRRAVRRAAEPEDDRLCVDDSKLVFSQTRGLHELEKSVLAALRSARVSADPVPEGETRPSLREFLARVSPDSCEELSSEPWYVGTTALPLECESDPVGTAAQRFHEACADRGIAWGLVRSVIVCPSRFNDLVDRWGSKGAVLGLGLVELLRAARRPDDGDEPITFAVDKHGGRNTYSAVLQHALDDGMVLARQETARRSRYEVIGLDRPVTITFEPRADAGHFCVALASMISKYLREALMHEFNQFWQKHVPDIKPTAGYPGDSRRFFDEIRPVLPRLGIREKALWRER